MAKNSGTPAWVWIGCGCVLAIVLLIAGIGGLGFLSFNVLKDAVEDMADPEARRAKALELLGAEAMPEGYDVQGVFEIPWVLSLVVLTDAGLAPGAVEGSFEEKAESLENLVLRQDQLGRHTFIYVKARGRGDEPLEKVLSGENKGSGVQVDLGLSFRVDEELGGGELEIRGQRIRYTARRGKVGALGGEGPAVWATLDFECPGGEHHDAVWIEQVEPPAEAGGDAAPEPAGTPADEDALRRFLETFDVCA